MKIPFKRFLPLIAILLLMAFAYIFGLADYFTFEQLKKHREWLLTFVNTAPLLAPLIFISVYIISTALSLPGGALLSLFSGFLFDQPYATLYVLIGATTGATLIFLAAKTALGDSLKKKAGPTLNKMQKGFQEDAASYLLFLRLVPLFPFWLVNLAPAFFGVRLSTFVWTTFVGIIPGAFVFTQAGTGLGSIFDKGEKFSLNTIFNTDIKIALFALAIFALIPPLVKRLRRKKIDD